MVPGLCVGISADGTTARVVFLPAISGNVMVSELTADDPEAPAPSPPAG